MGRKLAIARQLGWARRIESLGSKTKRKKREGEEESKRGNDDQV